MGSSKVKAASKGCDNAQVAWSEAKAALSGTVQVNGYGIYFDQGEPLRRKLRQAQAQIDLALAELKAIEWPSDSDYDDHEKPV